MLSFKYNIEKISSIVCNCRRNFSCSRWLSLTHYEVLNVKQNSTQREIRDAYIKLCKENHPDRDKKDETLHKKFLRINEAYNILSKPQTRKSYDQSIAYMSDERRIRSVIVKDHYYNDDYRRVWRHPSFYHNRKDEFMNSEPVSDDKYYGVNGIKRFSNSTWFVLLLMISLVSGFIQIYAIRNSVMFSERNRISEESGRILMELREKTDAQTEEENIEELERSYYANLAKINPNHKDKAIDK